MLWPWLLSIVCLVAFRAAGFVKSDLALLVGRSRTLVTAKWSIRADREEQFMSDFQAYERLEAAGQDFGYVLITNEFDAARLRAACERRRQNAPLFTQTGNAEGRMKVRSEKRRVSGGESPPSLEAKPLEFGAKAMDGKV